MDATDSGVAIGAPGSPAGPCAIALFGAGGDLTKRKLIPSIYNLARGKLLPEQFAIVGVSIEPFSTEEFRKQHDRRHQAIRRRRRRSCLRGTGSSSASITSPAISRIRSSTPNSCEALKTVDKEQGTQGNFSSIWRPVPNFFPVVVEQLGAAGLTKQESNKWRRVVIEKPFGHDLPSAVALNHAVGQVVDEKQIYRIDHYLGKETVQNILAFRFANGIFEPIWNRRYVDHVQVTVAEELGVELRGGYYENAGALRDMVPNHIFQLITLSRHGAAH